MDDAKVPELSRWKKLLFGTVTFLILATLLEVGAGVYLRYSQGYDGEHLYQYDFDAYRNIRLKPHWTDIRGIRHNAQGFRRDGEVSVEKPDGTFRIFLMGGSTAYGTGGLWPHLQTEFEVLDNSETISAYLEERLDRDFSDVRIEVINAAVPSTWTHHHLIYLNQEIFKYDPDMVLFLDGFNDFFHNDPGHDQFAAYAYGEQSRVILGPPTLGSLASANAWWLFRKSAFFHVVFRVARNVRQVIAGPGDRTPNDVERSIEQLRINFPKNALAMIRRTALIVEGEGVDAVFMIQPMLILERERPGLEGIERELFEFNVTSYVDNYEDYIQQAVPLVSELEREALAETSAGFMDLTGIYHDTEGQIFTDYAHLTPHGNQVLVDVVAEYITPRIQARLDGVETGAETEGEGM